jgi:hypothetical protein
MEEHQCIRFREFLCERCQLLLSLPYVTQILGRVRIEGSFNRFHLSYRERHINTDFTAVTRGKAYKIPLRTSRFDSGNDSVRQNNQQEQKSRELT